MPAGHTLNQNQPETAGVSGLSDEQFAILVDLLTPVHELALAQLAMIAEMKASKTPEPVDPVKTGDDTA